MILYRKKSGLKNFLSVLFSVLVRCVLQGSSLFLFPFWLKDFHLYVQHFCFWSCQTIVFAFFVVAVHFIDNSTGVCFGCVTGCGHGHSFSLFALHSPV